MNKIQNEKWVNALPSEAVNIAEEINIEIAKVIAERIKTIGELSPSDIKKLTNSLEYLGADFGKITKLIAKYSGKGQQAVVDTLKQVADANDEFAHTFYSAKGIASHTWRNDQYLHSLVESMARQTAAEFTNLSQTLAYKIDDRYIPLRQMYSRAIDKAIYEVQSGTVDYHTAMRKTVRELATGLRVKDSTLVVDKETGEVKLHWDSGYSRRLDSHIRQNLIDGIKQLQSQILDYHGEQFGSDGVELSAHAISAPDHLPVQGRQFSNEEFFKMQNAMDFEDVNGKQYLAFPRPIGQWNCRHVKFPIIIGISKPVHSDEQLKEFAENSKKKYDLTQQQRAMETKLRSLKTQRLAASAAGDELEAKRLQRKINEQQTAYRKFSEEHDLYYDRKRATVEGYRRIAVKTNLIANDNIIEWNSKGEIITLEKYKELREYATNKGIILRGFKNSDVDITLAKEFVDDAYNILREYPEILRNGKAPFTFQLDYRMKSVDFAETSEGTTHIIKLNGNAMRSKEKLSEEYLKLSNEGFFVKGTTYHSIIDHEFGHILGDIKKVNSLETLQEIIGVSTKTEVLNWCGENISEYSILLKDGTEIISEAFSAYRSNKANEIILTFLEKYNII